MRFQYNARFHTGNDMEAISIIFSARTWDDALKHVEVYLGQIGYKQTDIAYSEIIYAKKVS